MANVAIGFIIEIKSGTRLRTITPINECPIYISLELSLPYLAQINVNLCFGSYLMTRMNADVASKNIDI